MIVYLAKTKAEAKYIETKLQFDFDVLKNNKFYNGQIWYRGSKLGLKEYDRYKYILSRDLIKGIVGDI